MQRALLTRRAVPDLRNLIAVAAVIAGVVATEASAQDRGRSAQTLTERTPLQWIQAIQQAAIRVNYGLQRHRGGGMAIRTLACLPAVVGAWRDFGGGILLSTSSMFPLNGSTSIC